MSSLSIQNSSEVFTNLNTKSLKVSQFALANSLSVAGNATLASDLSVAGNSTLASDLSVAGNSTLAGLLSPASLYLSDVDSEKSTTSATLTATVTGGSLVLAADNVHFNMGCSVGHLDLSSDGVVPFSWTPSAAGDILVLSVELTGGPCTPEVGDRLLSSVAASPDAFSLASAYVSATNTLEFRLRAASTTPMLGVVINMMLYGMEGTDCVVTVV